MHKLKVVPTSEKSSILEKVQRPATLVRRHLLSLHDLSPQDIDFLLKLAQEVKVDPSRYGRALEGRTLAMLLEKPSLCSRVACELGISQLGGRALRLGADEMGVSTRQAVKDVARDLSRWVDVIMARVHLHQTVIDLAEHATVPVINGLSNFEHPCQVLSDYLTLTEAKGVLSELTLAWVGDGNNVAHSLIYGAARLGTRMRIATPPGHEPDRSVMAEAKREGADVTLTHDPLEAVAGSDVVYTAVWANVEGEDETEAREEVFRRYQVNSQLLRAAGTPGFVHALPTGAPRRRGNRRGYGLSPLPRLSTSGKSPSHAESHLPGPAVMRLACVGLGHKAQLSIHCRFMTLAR